MQRVKSGGGQAEEEAVQAIAAAIADAMDDGRLYVMGPGTTIGAIMDHLEIQNTLLGVDVVRDKALVAGDVGEVKLLELMGDGEATIVVTVIGGQGYILAVATSSSAPGSCARSARKASRSSRPARSWPPWAEVRCW